jgi:anhydro-N-acetylmuramic acid kinase
VDPVLLSELLAQPYFRRPPPKSTGRELFSAAYAESVWAKAAVRNLPPEDTIATLTALTAHSIARAYQDFLPQMPEEVIVSGGGANNQTLMTMLRDKLAPAIVRLSEEVGIPGDAKEALAFAILAYETWHGRPGNLPAATGASRAVILGQITR